MYAPCIISSNISKSWRYGPLLSSVLGLRRKLRQKRPSVAQEHLRTPKLLTYDSFFLISVSSSFFFWQNVVFYIPPYLKYFSGTFWCGKVYVYIKWDLKCPQLNFLIVCFIDFYKWMTKNKVNHTLFYSVLISKHLNH